MSFQFHSKDRGQRTEMLAVQTVHPENGYEEIKRLKEWSVHFSC